MEELLANARLLAVAFIFLSFVVFVLWRERPWNVRAARTTQQMRTQVSSIINSSPSPTWDNVAEVKAWRSRTIA